MHRRSSSLSMQKCSYLSVYKFITFSQKSSKTHLLQDVRKQFDAIRRFLLSHNHRPFPSSLPNAPGECSTCTLPARAVGGAYLIIWKRIEKLIRAGIRIALTMPSVNYWALSGVSNLALDAFLWNVWESFHRRRFWCWSAAGGQKVHHEMSFDWREKAVFLQSTAKAEPPSSVEEKGEVIDQLESKFLGMYIVYRS